VDDLESPSVTIYNIAAEAGVSISTVSRVINGKDRVSPKTKNRIQKAIQKYHYAPSQTARSMVNKQSKTIGIIIPEIRNPFFSNVIGDIDKILNRHGYTILLYICEFSSEKESKAINDLLGRNADGLIFLSSGLNDELIRKQIRDKKAVVGFHSNVTGVDSINVMNRQAFSEVAEHLISLGHRDIACIGGNNITRQQGERLNGYYSVLRKYHIPIREELVFDKSGGNDDSVIAATKEILHLKHPPTAIMATNDYSAVDVYQAISELHLRVGEDIAVTGFDNTSISALMNPALTTVDSPTKLIAEIATDFLLKRMLYGDQSGPKEISIPGKLIIRNSTMRLK
jgi:LacI family transcriptional regulator